MLSVCIVNWNTCQFLRVCLQSLRDEPPETEMEILVADNASADGSAEMVRTEFPQVTLSSPMTPISVMPPGTTNALKPVTANMSCC